MEMSTSWECILVLLLKNLQSKINLQIETVSISSAQLVFLEYFQYARPFPRHWEYVNKTVLALEEFKSLMKSSSQ